MNKAITRMRSKAHSVLKGINGAFASERGLTTAEMSYVLLGLIGLAVLLIWGINTFVENNIANLPDHTDLP